MYGELVVSFLYHRFYTFLYFFLYRIVSSKHYEFSDRYISDNSYYTFLSNL